MNTNTSSITILPFHASHVNGVEAMLQDIAKEYDENFFHQPYKTMEDLAMLPNRHYWVALAGETIIGTVGVLLKDNYAVLKSLFLAKEFRGAELQVANKLMQVATAKAIENGKSIMYLGTMQQFKGAQRFYEKHGYTFTPISELPADFPHNALDVVFYNKAL